MHEEDFGVLKFTDTLRGDVTVRRSRRLVVRRSPPSAIMSMFFWYFYQDGRLAWK
jgi:Cu2+-containing amine oxidase